MAKQRNANVPFELAAKIRELLDAAAESYSGDWEGEEVERQVFDLLSEDDE